MTEALQLLEGINKQNLYQNLLLQLEKDFLLCNEVIDIRKDTNPHDLISILNQKVYQLISFNFNEYLNLLYIIDVSEDKIKQLDGSDLSILSQQVAFEILKREWQKVYYKNMYK
jgi:hypothetical protein